jgi:hypothetical protein
MVLSPQRYLEHRTRRMTGANLGKEPRPSRLPSPIDAV